MRAQSRAKIMANACKIMIFEAMIAGWYGVRVTVLLYVPVVPVLLKYY